MQVSLSITLQDAKLINKILSFYQHSHLATEKIIRKKLKERPADFTEEDLDGFEGAIVGIYEAGYAGERIQQFIAEHESSNN